MARKTDLGKQAQEILEIAEKSGVQSNFLFVTTFKRYCDILQELDKAKKDLDAGELTIDKKYENGSRAKITAPNVRTYLSIARQADNTAALLMKQIDMFKMPNSTDDTDPLLAALNG